MENKTITITFGDQAENHVGMEKIGNLAENGFTLDDLKYCYSMFHQISNGTAKMELYHLNSVLPQDLPTAKPEDAYILIIRNGLDILLSKENKSSNDIANEQNSLNPDTKMYSHGSVKNKNKRYNLCFSDYSQVANFEQGKGTIINFNDVPYTKYIRDWLPILLGEKARNLQGEGNYYYDIKKTLIGWHGDAERKKVVAFRVGASIPLVFIWFHKFKPITAMCKFILNNGDMYVMSEKATGNDWKRSSILTLRHAAGLEHLLQKELDIKERKRNKKK